MKQRFIPRPVVLGIILVLGALSACDRADPLMPTDAPAAQVQPGDARALEVKFREGLAVRHSGGALASARGASLDGVTALLDSRQGIVVQPLFTGGSELDRLAEAALSSGEAPPDLRSWYRVVAPTAADAERLLGELKARPEVEHAYPAPVPAPPPGLFTMAGTPDFTGQQGYLGAPPTGTDAAWARTLPGGGGAGVMVVDLEYDWYLAHEDLGLPLSTQIGTGVRYTGYGNHHGTAVLGELAGRVNGLGVSGGVPDAQVRVIPPIYGGYYNPANAVAEAAAIMSPGDVLLIEQQASSPTGTYVPLEVLQSVFDATRAATLAGRVVVAAAGNGGQNLDDPAMNGLFNRNIRDSGALIVGAGSSLHARLYFSCYGSRVDVQGWGQGVTTTGYGGLFGTGFANYYTGSFNGTSSASPIVAAAVAAVQGRRKARGLAPLGAVQVRALLAATGTPQTGDTTQHIGPFPNFRAALAEATAPAAPDSVAAALLSATAIRVSWATTGADSVSHFEVRRRTMNADSTWGPWVVAGSPGGLARAYDDAGLTTGSTYQHRVRACNGTLCSTFRVGGAIALAQPTAPVNLALSPLSGTELLLTWSDGRANETGFRLVRRQLLADGTWSAYQQVAAPNANATRHTDTGLTPGTAYRYRLDACNGAGCSGTRSAPVVMPSVPAVPSPVAASVVSPSSIRVLWTDASANETVFVITRRMRNADGSWAAWGDRGRVRANLTSFADSAAPGVYQYLVRACDRPLCSTWTTAAQVELPPPPGTPGGVTATAVSATAAQVKWTDASINENSFQVVRRLQNLDGSWPPLQTVATLPANSTSFQNGGLLPGRVYDYRVRACAGAVCSPWSTVARVALP